MSIGLRLLESFFPPDLDGHYIAALAAPMVETLGVTLAAMVFAAAFSLPAAMLIATRARGSGALGIVFTLLRTIPDLTLAILCVILLGIGPGAGMVALICYYTAAMTKVFADLLTAAPRAPIDALRTAGASRFQAVVLAALPLASQDIFTYGAFAFECALRSAVIVGAVGGGGIGVELVGSLNGFEFRRATTLILLLMLTIAVLDRVAEATRRKPRTLLIAIPFGLAAAWWWRPEFFAGGHTLSVLASMLPPTLPVEARMALPQLIWETIWIAALGTSGAALVALPFALFASRLLSPVWIAFPARRALELFRAIPEIVWGLVLVAVAGVGPMAGAFALGLHSFGSLGRLFADTLDAAPREPQTALALTGASRPVVFLYGTLPLSLRQMAVHLLFRLDWNLRMATILGLIGAGGVGQALYQAQQLFFYDQVLAYVLVTAGLILVADLASTAARKRLNADRSRERRICADVALAT